MSFSKPHRTDKAKGLKIMSKWKKSGNHMALTGNDYHVEVYKLPSHYRMFLGFHGNIFETVGVPRNARIETSPEGRTELHTMMAEAKYLIAQLEGTDPHMFPEQVGFQFKKGGYLETCTACSKEYLTRHSNQQPARCKHCFENPPSVANFERSKTVIFEMLKVYLLVGVIDKSLTLKEVPDSDLTGTRVLYSDKNNLIVSSERSHGQAELSAALQTLKDVRIITPKTGQL
jgi:hypothetical protein